MNHFSPTVNDILILTITVQWHQPPILAKNIVSRIEAISDRGYQEIKFTAKATELIPKLAIIADENDKHFFSVLTASEKNSVHINQGKQYHSLMLVSAYMKNNNKPSLKIDRPNLTPLLLSFY